MTSYIIFVVVFPSASSVLLSHIPSKTSTVENPLPTKNLFPLFFFSQLIFFSCKPLPVLLLPVQQNNFYLNYHHGKVVVSLAMRPMQLAYPWRGRPPLFQIKCPAHWVANKWMREKKKTKIKWKKHWIIKNQSPPVQNDVYRYFILNNFKFVIIYI